MSDGTHYDGVMGPHPSGPQRHHDGFRILARLIVRRILREARQQTDSKVEGANDITQQVGDESDHGEPCDEKM